jgi:hypothetical protein
MAAYDPKPGYGQPCNACGRCCVSKPCELSRAIWADDVCPAIENRPSGFRCGLMSRPLHYVPKLRRHGAAKLAAAARLLLGSGIGCDARYHGEENTAFAERWSAYRIEHASERRKARRIWGLAPLGPLAQRDDG